MAKPKYDLDVEALTPNQLVSYFLMASYLYYHQDTGVIPDTTFDRLCVRLLSVWRQADHRHKKLIKLGDLRAGTGYKILEQHYPTIIKGAAWHWHEQNAA